MMKRIIGIILGIIGIALCIKGFVDRKVCAATVSIIGGADGPTSIFLAGKIGSTPIQTSTSVSRFPVVLIIVGIILLIVSGILLFFKRNKH